MIRRETWPNGANNRAPANRLPEGFVRRLVNLDSNTAGSLDLRPGYERVLPLGDVRAGGRAGRFAVLVDGNNVVAFDTHTQSHQIVGALAEPGPVACAEFNDRLYLSTLSHGYRCDGERLADWSIPEPAFSVSAGTGTLTGQFKIAVTALGPDGEESGAHPRVIVLNKQSLQIASDDSRVLRLYVSAPNTESLYFQGLLIGSAAITAVRDDTERLATQNLVPMPPVDLLAGHHAVLIGAQDRYVFVTVPMMSHLVDPVRGFFQYSAPVVLLAATEGGVFVATETRTYFLSGLESAPSQREVLDIGAVAGTAVRLPDGSAAWFTRMGQVIGRADGSVQMLTHPNYAPDVAAVGAAGLVDHNGLQRIVTTMRGPTEGNHMAAGDFADLETGND